MIPKQQRLDFSLLGRILVNSYTVKFPILKSMKMKTGVILLILMLILPIFLDYSLPTKAETTQTSPGLYVGVDIAFESVPATEQLIDQISSYTNIVVLGCSGYYNLTRLTTLSQYE